MNMKTREKGSKAYTRCVEILTNAVTIWGASYTTQTRHRALTTLRIGALTGAGGGTRANLPRNWGRRARIQVCYNDVTTVGNLPRSFVLIWLEIPDRGLRARMEWDLHIGLDALWRRIDWLMTEEERNPRPMCRLAMVFLCGAQATLDPRFQWITHHKDRSPLNQQFELAKRKRAELFYITTVRL
jgi:hypothetical protein